MYINIIYCVRSTKKKKKKMTKPGKASDKLDVPKVNKEKKLIKRLPTPPDGGFVDILYLIVI